MLVCLCSALCYAGGIFRCTRKLVCVGTGRPRCGTSGDLFWGQPRCKTSGDLVSLFLESVSQIYKTGPPFVLLILHDQAILAPISWRRIRHLTGQPEPLIWEFEVRSETQSWRLAMKSSSWQPCGWRPSTPCREGLEELGPGLPMADCSWLPWLGGSLLPSYFMSVLFKLVAISCNQNNFNQ